MSEFVKKSVLGYKPMPGGYSDPECTHVIMTKKEYDDILNEKSRAEREKRNAELEAERTVRKAAGEANAKIQRAEEAAKLKVEGIRSELESAKTEIDYQRRLNDNLLRISKERANASRKLKPKKEHTGYAVVSSKEKKYKYKRGRYWDTVRLWETTIQSPYSVDFTEEQARKQMLEALFNKCDNGRWFIGKIGITGNYDGTYDEMLSNKDWETSHAEYNVMLDRRLQANHISDYWEIVFTHTKPLSVVPIDMKKSKRIESKSV